MSVGRFCVRNVATVHPAEMVDVAAERMAEREVGSLVVVEDGKPIGILTDRDLVLRVLAQRSSPSQTEVRSVMTPNPICVSENAALEGAIEQMRCYRIRRLVVVNEAQEVTGMIAFDDILELLAEERQAIEAIAEVMRAARREKI